MKRISLARASAAALALPAFAKTTINNLPATSPKSTDLLPAQQGNLTVIA